MIETELREFYRALLDRPLPPADPAYVPLYADAPLDPVEKLATTIEWAAGGSAQLFSGFRGSGKSTELQRLRALLTARGYQVVLCDMEDYLNTTTPVDISDFLLAMAGALGEALAAGPLAGRDPTRVGYWERFATWLTTTRVEIPEVGVPGAMLKASLKQDPGFKEKLQARMAGHLSGLVADVRAYVRECTAAVEAAHPGQPLVLLLDSIEHVRGTAVNAEAVASALVTLFFGHGDKLRFDDLHVVYTVPPWLKIREPGAAGAFDAAVQLPCVTVTGRDGGRVRPGRWALHDALTKRGPWQALVTPEDADRLIGMSGGHLRDLLRLVREMLVRLRGRETPASPELVTQAIEHVRSQYLPIANADARWLARIAVTHSTDLPDQTRLPDLARYFDSLLVMTYDDGQEWWDVHPLVRDHVLAQAAADEQGG